MALRLPAGEVTVLLGPGLVRRRIMAALDDDSGRDTTGRGTAVRRIGAAKHDPLAARRAAVAAAGGAALVLADRLTDGLDGAGRRTVLADLLALAATGTAVLVDDADPVAATAVARGALRADREGRLVLEPLEIGDLAS